YYDVTKPTTTIYEPGQASFISAMSQVKGTAYDKTAEVESLLASGVQVRVLEEGGDWWGGVTFNQPDGNSAWRDAVVGSTTSWVFDDSFITAQLISGTTYLVQARVKDRAVPANQGPSSDGTDSNFTLGVDSVTIRADKDPPVSGIFLPPQGPTTYSKSLPVISGTSFDAISRITDKSQVTLSIKEDNPSGRWWNSASTFTETSEQFYEATSLLAENSTWTQTSPNYTHGYTYLIRVQATDNVGPPGNSEPLVSLASATFIYDINYPTATVTFPANGSVESQLTAVTGNTVEEFVTNEVRITMRDDTTGLWWDQGGSTFTLIDAAKVFYLATPDTPGDWSNWTWAFDEAKLQNGRDYTIQIYALDAAGNQQPNQTSGFKWDVEDPVSFVSLPQDGSFKGVGTLTIITGTADDINNINKVEVSIRRVSDGWYWDTSRNDFYNNGGTPLYIGTPATLLPPALILPRIWEQTAQLPPDGKLGNGEQYRVQVRATDSPGNVQQIIDPGIVFTYDVSPPSVDIQFPEEDGIYPAITVLSGTAQDNFNTKQVQIRMKNKSSNEYWDDSIPGFDAPDVWNVADGSSPTNSTVDWTYTSLPAPWANQSYELNVRAVDEAGNFTAIYSTITKFTFDNVPPTTVSTYPVSGLTYNFISNIAGTAQDGSDPRDVDQIRVKIWRVIGGTTDYWDAGNWDTPVAWNLVSYKNNVSGSLWNWVYAHPDFVKQAPLPHAWDTNTTYYFMSRAFDKAGNLGVESSTKSFVFDNLAPVSRVSLPGADQAYHSSDLTILSGTSVDETSPLTDVKIWIKEEEGNKWFDGGGFDSNTSYYFSVSQLFSASWTYTSGALSTEFDAGDGNHYVIQSSASDVIGNIEAPTVQNRFLIDKTKPDSIVNMPVNGMVYEPNRTIYGTAADPGFTTGIDGTGSGVVNTLGWHQGNIEILLLRDEDPINLGGGPISYPNYGGNDYFWNGSTWVLTGGGETWRAVDSVEANGNWTFSDIVTSSGWVKGKFYTAWIRATDNAGNVQTASINPGPQFQIADPADHFIITGLTDGEVAGFDHTVTVEAVDSEGYRATAYPGTVTFSVANGHESPDDNDTVDDIYGLPKNYTFTQADAGIKTFTTSVRFRRSGLRELRVNDTIDPISGLQSNITVLSAAAERLLVVPDGQNHSPGETTAPNGGDGVSDSPATKTAGNSIVTEIMVVDKYWNIVTSSNPTVNVTTSDPFDTEPGSTALSGGTKTVNIVMTTAGNQTITASGAGIPGTSDVITINPDSADRLVAVLPGETRTQGKYNVAPFGKSGTVSYIAAGVPMNVDVYSVDQFFNLDTSVGIQVNAQLPNDDYDITPAPLTLVSGATAFVLTPIVAG
ncbi:hypothetical protein BVX98_07190, partial [bacterium F11]